jgi:hypothetical protein
MAMKQWSCISVHICVRGINFDFFKDFLLYFWNCSDSVVYYDNHFVFILEILIDC